MNLESIVTSLALSQKLEEIGIKQESLFCWYESVAALPVTTWVGLPNSSLAGSQRICWAFTAQELWDMIEEPENWDVALFARSNKQAHLYASRPKQTDCGWMFRGHNIANCLAQLIIVQHEDNKK